MKEETIYAHPHKRTCTECGKKILVSIANIGTSHVANITVSCGACTAKTGINKSWADKFPNEAEELEKWLNH